MTQTIRLLGRFLNASQEALDLVCDVATASVPPSRREIGAGGDVQLSMRPTGIVLYGITDEGFSALTKGTWTHIEWTFAQGGDPRELQISSMTREGRNGRDLRVLVR